MNPNSLDTMAATRQAESSRGGTVSVFELARLTQAAPFSPNSELRCRQIIPEEAAAIQAVMEQAGVYEPNDAARRLVNGREGFVGEVETDAGPLIVTYGWVAYDSEPLGQSGIAFQPPPGDAYLYDFATLPQHRGHGYYPTLLRYIVSQLAERGYRCAWIGTAPGNDVSARSIARAGFQLVGYTGYVPPTPEVPAHFDLHPVEDVPAFILDDIRNAHISAKLVDNQD